MVIFRCGLVLATFFVFFSGQALAAVQAEAIPGSPFGIGRVTVLLPAADAQAAADGTGRFLLTEKNGRALYPAFTTGIVRRVLGDIISVPGIGASASITVYFLFKGNDPLRLTISTPTVTSVEVIPRSQPPRFESRMLRIWWREYNAVARKRVSEGGYPPLVETYLTTMLAQRLGLKPPLLTQLTQEKPSQQQQALELLAGVESLRAATMRDTLQGQGGISEAADQRVPADIVWPPLLLPPALEGVLVEPIALHVPQECFYIRFGQFANYVWMNNLIEEYGGDISRMINLRGHKADYNGRMQKQLALKLTVLREILGGTIISDVAIIGRDTYLREGAAIGVLFQARNDLLKIELSNLQAATLKENEKQGATLQTIEIAGHPVAFLSTPDNRLRSFYAIDGKFHLVTTSRSIVQRFYEAGQHQLALGDSPEFQHARSIMPLDRDDTIFIYLSPSFFHGLVSPQYQIELTRRLKSVIDMELLQMAYLASHSEGHLGRTIDDMVRAQLLPVGFGRREDGSRLVTQENHWIDSLRGARGNFLPIADVNLQSVTRSEADRYASHASFYRRQWTEMDPLMVGIKRFALNEKGLERIVIDAYVSPLVEKKYGWLLSLLGPPTTEKISSPAGDIISFQAMVKGGLLSPSLPPHHLFLGVRDDTPLIDLRPTGLLRVLRVMQATPAYLGAWPKPGFLDLFQLGLAGEVDSLGYSRLPFGLWRRQGGGFSVVSFDRRVLAEVTPHLKVEEATSPAQVRLHIGDVSKSKLAAQIDAMSYERARQTSTGNTRLLHALTQQLKVPPEKALATAEQLLDVQLVCALDGQYKLVHQPDGIEHWESTKWPQTILGSGYEIPEDYKAPLLKWFRGLDAQLTKNESRMKLHLQFDMQRSKSATKIKLPLFDLFGGKKPKPPLPKVLLPKPPVEKKPREF